MKKKKIPMPQDNPNGLHKRYSVRKLVPDGPLALAVMEEDQDAEYFVLRLDDGGDDLNHVNACRIALSNYAEAIKPHLPQLAYEIGERWPADQPVTFQEGVKKWMLECFGREGCNNIRERNFRFIEEAIELSQSCGLHKEEVLKVVDYVYGRPIGEPAQEIGGVMVTLAALCLATYKDLNECADNELARIWTKIDEKREKQVTLQVMGVADSGNFDAQPGVPVDPTKYDADDLIRTWREGFKVGEMVELPNDKEVESWFAEMIGPDCSASSGIYLFRQWLEQRNKINLEQSKPIATKETGADYYWWLHEVTTLGYDKKVIIQTRHGETIAGYFEKNLTPEQAITEYIKETGQERKEATND